MSIMKDVGKKKFWINSMYCTGIFLEGMRRNNAKDLTQIACFRVEFEDRTVRLQKRSVTNCTAKVCLYKQLCKAACTYANFT